MTSPPPLDRSTPIDLIDSTPDTPEALVLIDELSDCLRAITGDDGRKNFNAHVPPSPRARFVIAWHAGAPVGCGALRPLGEAHDAPIGEIKRMYARRPGLGIGSRMLAALERHAVSLGYEALWLETRQVNTTAVKFYLRHGYTVRENYGPYVGRPEAVCFEKTL